MASGVFCLKIVKHVPGGTYMEQQFWLEERKYNSSSAVEFFLSGPLFSGCWGCSGSVFVKVQASCHFPVLEGVEGVVAWLS